MCHDLCVLGLGLMMSGLVNIPIFTAFWKENTGIITLTGISAHIIGS